MPGGLKYCLSYSAFRRGLHASNPDRSCRLGLLVSQPCAFRRETGLGTRRSPASSPHHSSQPSGSEVDVAFIGLASHNHTLTGRGCVIDFPARKMTRSESFTVTGSSATPDTSPAEDRVRPRKGAGERPTAQQGCLPSISSRDKAETVRTNDNPIRNGAKSDNTHLGHVGDTFGTYHSNTRSKAPTRGLSDPTNPQFRRRITGKAMER
jgi:hypothetical protein